MLILKLTVFLYWCSIVTKCVKHPKDSTIFAIRPIECQGPESSEGIPIVYASHTTKLYLFGHNLTPSSEIGFTSETDCDYPIPSVVWLSNSSGVVTFTPPSKRPVWSRTKYYTCLKDGGEEHSMWIHQGTGKHVTLYVVEPLFTSWSYIAIIIVCYILSSLMTGLNLGLMSLDNSELQLLRNAGTPKERKYAGKIIPIRRNGNFLVCSVVITATLCNAVSTVATDSFFSDIITVVITTLMIVLFCEILPQSICSAYPLQIGAKTVYITRTCMILTFPVSYPLSEILNFIVGKELTKSYNKERLKELLKKTNLPTHEEKIISGILDFSSKKVEDVMTNLNDIFKLPITAVMNFETIAEILASGYSRVPIYVGDKWNIQYVLLTKELALLDPDEKIPVKVLVQNPNSACHYVSKGTSLDEVFKSFKDSRRHMLFVTDDENNADKRKDNVIGLVTFEDIIEEIFQMEILDETDTVSDNRGKRKISITQKTDIITLLLQPTKANVPSENVKLATYCFLSEIEEFSMKHLSPKVLISLLNLDIYYTSSGNKLPQDTIYVTGVPADFFVMILEGEVEVKIGLEELSFEVGPFRHFGVEALKKASFTPDYTLQAIKKTLYLKISTTLYTTALLATRYERFKEVPHLNPNSDMLKYFNLIVGSDHT
ncbi:unextended protein-like [Macrosteles quadrilineatus]|uniref:unextended protein-like n=1 Tax=Macrosteles quadrilineatus TaxID=74068 RepID=UPI0023E171D1|nr:unextended protein-like [Macrosteles quadrilineatus]